MGQQVLNTKYYIILEEALLRGGLGSSGPGALCVPANDLSEYLLLLDVDSLQM